MKNAEVLGLFDDVQEGKISADEFREYFADKPRGRQSPATPESLQEIIDKNVEKLSAFENTTAVCTDIARRWNNDHVKKGLNIQTSRVLKLVRDGSLKLPPQYNTAVRPRRSRVSQQQPETVESL